MFALVHLSDPSVKVRNFPDMESLLTAMRAVGGHVVDRDLHGTVIYSDFPRAQPLPVTSDPVPPINVRLMMDR